ncbi:hypothetical protein [Rivularia sp. UHCC 0363]|uniref:hypothetical protein n=1 Tax=Rivularia sp. UHCC 0363 TaxID=3110244 RepID=UPI002B2111DE|nr:hypothetical protein [Rivularia sp. UHCC 0363]MEA5594067.1 hypothetical protein [Rivularia sp. UHCC 0363]
MVITTIPKKHNLPESLGKATSNILHNAFYLAKQKLELSGKAYKQLLREWGWEKEDKKYLKVAQTFEKFSPLDLAEIEPDTLFGLSKQNKKYANVIEQLLDIGSITQEKVRELIKLSRKPRTSKPEKPTIWRRDRNGKRYCQVPPIDDEVTGVALQHMMDSEGKSAQQIVAEAVALRQAFIEGRLVVSDSQQKDDVETDTSSTNESHQTESQDSGDAEIGNYLDEQLVSKSVSENYAVFSDNIIFNSAATQETALLSANLLGVVENIMHIGSEEFKQVEELVASIVNFCASVPISEQWKVFTDITKRNSKALAVIIGYSGTYYKKWLSNLPQLIADASITNPIELEWVGNRLRTEALLLMDDGGVRCSNDVILS